MELAEIKHLASLSRIRITDGEAQALKHDIDAVLAYVSVVSEITSTDSDTPNVGARSNVFRKDEVTNTPGSYSAALLAEAPAREGDYLKVKKILNQD